MSFCIFFGASNTLRSDTIKTNHVRMVTLLLRVYAGGVECERKT